MTAPAKLFCDIMATRLNQTERLLTAATQEPSKFARVINSTIDRFTEYLYQTVYEQVSEIYESVLNILLLNKLNQLQGIGNWCQTLWACTALMNELIDNREIYLPFLSQETVEGFRTNYQSFDEQVCRLGVRKIFDNFLNDIFAKYHTMLMELKEKFDIQEKLNRLVEQYEEILENNGVYDYLELLRQFLDCVNNGVCDYSATAENSLQEWEEKLNLIRNPEGWTVSYAKKLTKYDERKAKVDAKIDETIRLMNQKATDGIKRADVMVF